VRRATITSGCSATSSAASAGNAEFVPIHPASVECNIAALHPAEVAQRPGERAGGTTRNDRALNDGRDACDSFLLGDGWQESHEQADAQDC